MRETEEKELLRTVARNIANLENNKQKQTQISFGWSTYMLYYIIYYILEINYSSFFFISPLEIFEM